MAPGPGIEERLRAVAAACLGAGVAKALRVAAGAPAEFAGVRWALRDAGFVELEPTLEVPEGEGREPPAARVVALASEDHGSWVAVLRTLPPASDEPEGGRGWRAEPGASRPGTA